MSSFEEIKDSIENLEFVSEGWRAHVYKGLYQGKLLAFKVAKRPEVIQAIQREGKILKIVNKVGIGGKLEVLGTNFIAYQFIEGKHLRDVINEENKRKLISQLFHQARTLDKLGIDKDEMQRPLKNALVDETGKVWLIDFERAKRTKKPSNITQLLQFATTLNLIDKNHAIQLGKIYKKAPTEENFQKILTAITEK